MIGFIGDIHGYGNELETLLQKLGFTKKSEHMPIRREKQYSLENILIAVLK